MFHKWSFQEKRLILGSNFTHSSTHISLKLHLAGVFYLFPFEPAYEYDFSLGILIWKVSKIISFQEPTTKICPLYTVTLKQFQNTF